MNETQSLRRQTPRLSEAASHSEQCQVTALTDTAATPLRRTPCTAYGATTIAMRNTLPPKAWATTMPRRSRSCGQGRSHERRSPCLDRPHSSIRPHLCSSRIVDPSTPPHYPSTDWLHLPAVVTVFRSCMHDQMRPPVRYARHRSRHDSDEWDILTRLPAAPRPQLLGHLSEDVQHRRLPV